MLQPIADAVTGRLEDKANQVRKNATQLLTTMLQFNPYHAKLNLTFFQEKQKACKALLEVYYCIIERVMIINSFYSRNMQRRKELSKKNGTRMRKRKKRTEKMALQ